MTRTWSSGSGGESCQTSDPTVEITRTVGFLARGLTPQTLWLLRAASTLHVAVLVSLWPASDSSQELNALVATAMILLALVLVMKPNDGARGSHHPQESSRAPKETPVTKVRVQEYGHNPRNLEARTQTPGSRLSPPVAAPHAVLAPGLDPQARAWADLMARLSHDLRTPLNAVIGFSQIMEHEAFGPLGSPRYQEYARHIQDCGTALLKSAEDALAVTSALTDVRDEDQDLNEPVDLAQLADECWTSVAPRARSRAVALRVEIPSGLEVQGERAALRQVLVNLLCEAITHAEPGAPVIVRAQGDLERVTLEVGTQSRAEGRDADTLPLCVAHMLLHLHGASLIVASDDGDGWRAVTVLERTRQDDFFCANVADDDRAPACARNAAMAA